MPVSAIQLLLGQISENFPQKSLHENNLNNKNNNNNKNKHISSLW